MSDALSALGPVSSGLFGFTVKGLRANRAFISVSERNSAGIGCSCPVGALSHVVGRFLPEFGRPLNWLSRSLLFWAQCVCRRQTWPAWVFPCLCSKHKQRLGLPARQVSPSQSHAGGFLPSLVLLTFGSSSSWSSRQASGARTPLHYTTPKHKTKNKLRCWESPCA